MGARSRVRVCVLGAGVVGLSAAVCIKEQLPDVEVTLVADKFGQETTSSVAGGLIMPHALGNTPTEKINEWVSSSRAEAARHFRGRDAGSTGVLLVPVYMAFTTKTEAPDWKDTAFGFRELSSAEIKILFGRSYATVFHFEAFLWEPIKYLPWLMSRFKRRGGVTQRRKVNTLNELLVEYDIVINCSGVGASQVTVDDEVFPIRGQIALAKAPWANYAFIMNDGQYYIIPGSESLKLGGTHQTGNWDVNVSEDDQIDILNGCTEMLPHLKGAKILSHRVGLRPGRAQVRLQRDNIMLNGKSTPVIHNYGHGGSGVGLSWGCGVETAQLVRECMTEFRLELSKL